MLASVNYMETITDLSHYYVVRKYKHGWILGKIGTNKDDFISREKLIELGYIADVDEEPNINMLSTIPPTAIVVPNGSLLKQKFKLRADSDPDWRKSKSDK